LCSTFNEGCEYPDPGYPDFATFLYVIKRVNPDPTTAVELESGFSDFLHGFKALVLKLFHAFQFLRTKPTLNKVHEEYLYNKWIDS